MEPIIKSFEHYNDREVAIEGFKSFDRFKLWLEEKGDMHRTIMKSMDFFNEHCTEAEIMEGLKKVALRNIKKEEVVKLLDVFGNILLYWINLHERVIQVRNYLELYSDPISKGLTTTDVLKLQAMYKSIGCNVWPDANNRYYCDADFSTLQEKFKVDKAALAPKLNISRKQDVMTLVNACDKSERILAKVYKPTYSQLHKTIPLYPKGKTPTEDEVKLARLNLERFICASNIGWDAQNFCIAMWVFITDLCVRLRKNV